MTWRPNRQFFRDLRYLRERNHSISYLRASNGEHVFWIDGSSTRPDGIARAANEYRAHPVWTQDDFDRAKTRSAELIAAFGVMRLESRFETGVDIGSDAP